MTDRRSPWRSTLLSALPLLVLAGGIAACGDDPAPAPGGSPDAAADAAPPPLDAPRADGADVGQLPDLAGDGALDAAPGVDQAPETAAADADAGAEAGAGDLPADVAVAPDGGIRSGCVLPGNAVCHEYGLDYSEASAKNHCDPNMGTAVMACPATLDGPRIGRCVTMGQFGTLNTIYYMRADPSSAMRSCMAQMGTWWAQ